MFYYLKGIVTYKDINFLVLDIGGAGYKVYTSYTTLENAELNKEYMVYTYTHIREDIFDIYGFKSKEELQTFLMLITISGVGPKAALAILSSMPTEVFATAVINNDVKEITKAPGIGKKTAERIILELKEKIEKNFKGISTPNDVLYKFTKETEASKEAIDALMVLGYSQLEAKGAVSNVPEGIDDVSKIVKEALKLLMN